jgi:hypothetical protein
MTSQNQPNNFQNLAEQVRKICIETALEAYEDAGIRGLCHEGRWECAIGAIKQIDLNTILKRQ